MANSKIKGITIELGGDTTKLDKALSSVEKQSKDLQTELKGVNTLLKLDPSNVELLTQKQKLLTDSISSTEDKLKTLKTAQAQVQAQFEKGDITEEQFRSFQREIIATEQKLKKLKDESKSFGSVFEQQVKVASESVKKLGGNVEEAGNKMGALSTGAVAGLTAAATSASSLEGAVNKFMATTGLAVEESKEWEKVLKNIHDGNYGEDYADIADKMRIAMAQLDGLDTIELQDVVEKSYMLQDAYDMDFQENIRGVDALMKQFGITSTQAFELINQGAKAGLNQNQDLTDQIAEYSTYYAKLGFTAEDFFNMMIAGARDGAYQIDYLNDAMKEFGIRTKDNSKSTNAAYETLGLNVEEVNNKFAQGGSKAQEAFAEVTKAIMAIEDPVKRNEIGVALFGTKFEDLEENAVFAMASASDSVNMLGNSVEKTSEIMYGGTANSAETAIRSIKTAFAELGQAILPILTPIANKITELAKKFQELNPTTQKIIAIVLGITAAIAPLLIVVGKVITAIGTIMPIIGGIATFITGTLIPAIGAVVTAIGWPVIAIAAVIGAIVLLWNKCEWFREGLKALWEGIKTVLLTIGEWINTNVIQPVIGFFQSLWTGIQVVWDGIVAAIKFAFNLIVAIITTYFQLITLPFRFIWENCKDIIMEFIDKAIEVIGNIVDWIVDKFNDLKENVIKIWNWIKEKIISPIQETYTKVKEFIGKMVEFVKTEFEKLKTKTTEIFTKLKESITKPINDAKNKVSEVVSSLKDSAIKRFNDLKTQATETFNKIKTAITSPIEKARDVVKGVVDKIKGFFNFKVSLPNIKLPHFSISPKGWKMGDLLEGSIPKLGIEWYAKGAILKKPTIFGTNGNNVMVGGEAGTEAIAPISELLKYVKLGVDESLRGALFDALTNFTNTKVQTRNTTIYGINELTHLLKVYMPEIIDNMGRDVVLDGKKVGQTIAPEINKQLGNIALANSRGR